jgi:uncharacterized repeat protein (TIGR04042 family)
MPETNFLLLWPDGSETVNYSPSSVIRNYFAAGQSYQLPEFLETARAALAAASARVQEVYGFPCARARATLTAIEQRAEAFTAAPEAAVTFLEFAG